MSFVTGSIPTDIGDQVRFRAASVFLGPEKSSLSGFPRDAEIEGEVIAFSDSGSNPQFYAVVEVAKTEIVIVPVGDLKVIEP